MSDPTQDAMAAAGFVQPGADGTIQTPPSQIIQAPVQAAPQVAPQAVAPMTVNTGTNVSPTTVISGNNDTVNNFSSMLQDNAGGISSMRCLMLLWGGGVFLMWAGAWIVGMVHGVYIPPTIPTEIVTILLGITGTKCIQRFGEKS